MQRTRLAQLVERKALNLVVVGSSPTVGGGKFLINYLIYTWYIHGDFLLLIFFLYKRAFRVDINEKYVLYKKEDNGIKYEINNC